MKKNLLIIHTFLFGIFPALSLYSHNIKQIPLDFLVRPLIFVIIFAVCIWLVTLCFLSDRIKASIVSSVCLLLFYSFPWSILERLENSLIHNPIQMQRYLLYILWGIICFFIIKPFWKTKSDQIKLSKLFNFTAVMIVAYNLAVMSYWVVRRDEVKQLVIPVSAAKSLKPDIYYIILDAYARNDVLIDYYKYDNQEFLSYLSNKGFYIADKSYSNYAFTELSVASSLNFDYVDSFTKNSQRKNNDRIPLITYIRENRLQKFLKKQGYEIIAFSTGFCPTEVNSSDRFFSPKLALTDLENQIINRTPLPIITRDLQYNAHRERILYTFNKISEIAAKESPKFVFAHIFAPHPPFVFGKNGEEIKHQKNFNRIDGKYLYKKAEYIEDYRNQLIFLNKKLRDTINQILAKKVRPAVIILQGDHGPRSMVNLSNEKDTSFSEAMSILLACYTSDCDNKLFYNSLTPVNIFRLILNHYFHTELKLLEDNSYFSTHQKYYDFINVNNKLQ